MAATPQPGGERATRDPEMDNNGQWKVIRRCWMKAENARGEFVDKCAFFGGVGASLLYFSTACQHADGIDKFVLIRPDGTIAMEYSPPGMRNY